jgi:hypothetical protein
MAHFIWRDSPGAGMRSFGGVSGDYKEGTGGLSNVVKTKKV